MKYYIAIDGGGTKTEGLLADEKGRVLSERKCGATNPNDIGEAEAAKRLCKLALLLENDAPERVASVFAGVSGAGNHREFLLTALKSAFPNAETGLGTDAEILFCAGIPQGDGACVISGTGSVCYVRKAGSYRRIGGWGWLLDTGGSGYDIGRDGLSAALRAFDGSGDSTQISGYIAERLGGKPSDKLTEIYDGGKPFIASLADCVFDADRDGDRIAGEILLRNANCLTVYLNTAGEILNKPYHAVLGGGIFENHPDFVALLKRTAAEIPVDLFISEKRQVYGAYYLAVQQDMG